MFYNHVTVLGTGYFSTGTTKYQQDHEIHAKCSMYVRQGEFSTSAQTVFFKCRKHLIRTLQLFTIHLRFLCWFNLLTMTSHKQLRVGVCRIE